MNLIKYILNLPDSYVIFKTIVCKNLCVLVLWTKEASALEGFGKHKHYIRARVAHERSLLCRVIIAKVDFPRGRHCLQWGVFYTQLVFTNHFDWVIV